MNVKDYDDEYIKEDTDKHLLEENSSFNNISEDNNKSMNNETNELNDNSNFNNDNDNENDNENENENDNENENENENDLEIPSIIFVSGGNKTDSINNNDNVDKAKPKKVKNTTSSKKDDASFSKNLLYSVDFEESARIIHMMHEDIDKVISLVSDDMNILQRASFLNKISSVRTIVKELKKILYDDDIKVYNFINSKNKRGYTSLHYSIICGNIEIYKFLIKNGADRNITTNSGYNNLILACQTKRTYVFLEEIKYQMINKKLDSNSLFNIKDKNNATLLHWAAFSDYLFGVQFLISLKDTKNKNINFINFINSKDNNNMIALQYALMNDSCKVITDLILLDDINLYNKDADERDCFDYADAMANEKFNDIIKIKNTELNKYKRFLYISLMLIFNILTYLIVLPVINKSFIIIVQLIINFVLIIGIIIVKYLIHPGYNKGSKNAFDNAIYNINENNVYRELTEISKYCPYCYIKKEKTTIKHCPICQACIENLVKHDIFLNKCIGKNNYFFYFLYKILFLIYLLYFIIISFFAIFKNLENKEAIVSPFLKVNMLYNEAAISIFCFGTIFIFAWILFATFCGIYKECRFKNNSILGYSRTWDKNNNENNKSKEEIKKNVKIKKI